MLDTLIGFYTVIGTILFIIVIIAVAMVVIAIIFVYLISFTMFLEKKLWELWIKLWINLGGNNNN
jgi:hypothetical protein